MSDPMTSPSPEMKNCPFCGRQPVAIAANEAHSLSAIVYCRCGGDVMGATRFGRTVADAIESWNRRELESRVSQSVPPDDYANRNIRTVELANAVARHLGLKPQDEIPFEELTQRLRQLEDQTAAATEYPGCAFDCPYPAAARVVHLHLSEFCDESLPFADMIADASRRAAAALKDARHWLSISEGNYRDMERQRDQITAEIASLKQQVIDSALRAERLEADRTAWQEFAEHVEHCVECGQTGPANCSDGGPLKDAAYRASLSPQPEDRT